MATEIRTRKTKDPEMDAILVLNQALAELDRPAAKRVLDWAEKRFVNPDAPMNVENMKGVTKFMQALEDTARTLEITPPAKLLDAMALVVDDLRVQRKLEEAT